MNLGQYLVQQLLEDNIQEVYPKRSSDDINQELVTREESEIERTAEEFNIPIPDIRLAFVAGNMVVLTDDSIWSKLENTDSWNIQSLEDAIKLAEKYKKDWKSTLAAIKAGKSIDPPMVLNYDQDKYYLVGGNTRLMFYKALGITPKVLMAVLNLKGPKPFPLKEGLDKDTLNSFLKFAIKELGLKQLPSKITLSKNTKKARERHTFGTFNPENKSIWLYTNNRNTADILRTLAHELVHRKQEEDSKLKPDSGETGSEIENEANAKAGILLRKFGEKNPMIYEGMYGNYLFGDKNTGVAVGWYKNEMEPDTPAEKRLFNILKKYADSEYQTYSVITLDDFVPIFKKLKKQYPEIVDPKLSSDTYIYRGTSLPKEQIDKLNAEIKDTIYYKQGYIIPNQTYESKRKVQSWSTNYFIASGFAFKSTEKRGGVPVIMRAKVSDADLYFNSKFMDKLSTQVEDETFNIINPIPVDIMVIDFYEDEFEDIEAGYLHTKDQNINENTQFNNWVEPSLEDLKREFKVEHELKGNDFFDSEEEFLEAANNGKIIEITPSMDNRIIDRSQTESYEDLLDLLKTYRSWGKYRSEDTLKAIYNGFKENKPMALPIVIEFSDGYQKIFSGNTRMDVAFQLGINPKVLLIKSKQEY